jgi:hypothetical protein
MENLFHLLPRDILKMIISYVEAMNDKLHLREALGRRGLPLDEVFFASATTRQYSTAYYESRLHQSNKKLLNKLSDTSSKKTFIQNKMLEKKFLQTQQPSENVIKAAKGEPLNFVAEKIHLLDDENVLLCGKRILCSKTKEQRRFLFNRSNSVVKSSFEPEFNQHHIFVSSSVVLKSRDRFIVGSNGGDLGVFQVESSATTVSATRHKIIDSGLESEVSALCLINNESNLVTVGSKKLSIWDTGKYRV